jgi:tRNA threonylcarbamoyladenosine modification (KEOPS) complex  Pcc1 subunit
MTKEKAITLNYLYSLRAHKVQTMALETEYPAGTYHIHMYALDAIIDFVEGLEGDDIMRILRYHAGLRTRPFTVGNPSSTRIRNAILHHLVLEMEHVEIYSQQGRIEWRTVEQLTRLEIGGKDVSKLRNTYCDLKLLQGYGLTECKAMGGLWSFSDKRDDELKWIVG